MSQPLPFELVLDDGEGWEAEEQATAEAYARRPDSSDAAFDPAVWEGRSTLDGD